MTPRRSATSTLASDVPLRIVVVDPPPNVRWALQLGRSELVAPKASSAESVELEFTIRVAGETKSGAPRLLGPAVQGRPEARFVYVNSGKRAGDPASCWDRRAKVPLGGITKQLVAKLRGDATTTSQEKTGTVLEARIAGRARDGGPACASVPLVGTGWRVVR